MPAAENPLLLLGATGMVGRAVRRRLARDGSVLHCVSRTPPPAEAAENTHWIRADLFGEPIEFDGESVLSAGPLDGLVAWLTRESPLGLRHVVALSSTSVHTKQDSADPGERELAQRLHAAEAALAAWCAARAVNWTVLRPTLIYDDGFDGALGRVVAVARRFGAVALPADARGLRQPVHADDVAQAALAAFERPQAFAQAYDLPGGESLDYRRMVARALAVAAPRARLLGLSPRVFAAVAPAARRIPALAGLTPEVISRMREDLVFDVGPAWRDLAYSPRSFPGGTA
jgi:nucleoside-diphosphate-sugar epimerase